MDNLPTTRPGETPRARADEFCVHSPRTLELRSIPSPVDHRNPTTSDAQRPSRLLPVPPPKLPCEPPADECVSTVSERTDHLYENSPSVLPCLPAAGAENEDNVSVSTDASCFTDISLETVSSPQAADCLSRDGLFSAFGKKRNPVSGSFLVFLQKPGQKYTLQQV